MVFHVCEKRGREKKKEKEKKGAINRNRQRECWGGRGGGFDVASEAH